jgi:hypothetical protein
MAYRVFWPPEAEEQLERILLRAPEFPRELARLMLICSRIRNRLVSLDMI